MIIETTNLSNTSQMIIEHVAENQVRITKASMLSGKQNQMVLPVRQGQIEYWIDTCMLVQDAFPQLDDDQREFLISGITPEEWDATFGEEE